jgi:hypothetical protein
MVRSSTLGNLAKSIVLINYLVASIARGVRKFSMANQREASTHPRYQIMLIIVDGEIFCEYGVRCTPSSGQLGGIVSPRNALRVVAR